MELLSNPLIETAKIVTRLSELPPSQIECVAGFPPNIPELLGKVAKLTPSDRQWLNSSPDELLPWLLKLLDHRNDFPKGANSNPVVEITTQRFSADYGPYYCDKCKNFWFPKEKIIELNKDFTDDQMNDEFKKELMIKAGYPLCSVTDHDDFLTFTIHYPPHYIHNIAWALIYKYNNWPNFEAIYNEFMKHPDILKLKFLFFEVSYVMVVILNYKYIYEKNIPGWVEGGNKKNLQKEIRGKKVSPEIRNVIKLENRFMNDIKFMNFKTKYTASESFLNPEKGLMSDKILNIIYEFLVIRHK